jgi:hypothetical protein
MTLVAVVIAEAMSGAAMYELVSIFEALIEELL